MENINFEMKLEDDLTAAIDDNNVEWAKWIIAVYCYLCIELPSFVHLDMNDDAVIIEKEGGEIFLRMTSSEVTRYVKRRFNILNE